MAPNETIVIEKKALRLIGGLRSQNVPATDVGGPQDHANALVHEVMVFDGTLTDAEMVSVYNALKQKWSPAPTGSGLYTSVLPTLTGKKLLLHWDATWGPSLYTVRQGVTNR